MKFISRNTSSKDISNELIVSPPKNIEKIKVDTNYSGGISTNFTFTIETTAQHGTKSFRDIKFSYYLAPVCNYE